MLTPYAKQLEELFKAYDARTSDDKESLRRQVLSVLAEINGIMEDDRIAVLAAQASDEQKKEADAIAHSAEIEEIGDADGPNNEMTATSDIVPDVQPFLEMGACGSSAPDAGIDLNEKLFRETRAKNLRQALTINDRFLFTRELFSNSKEIIDDALSRIESCGSFDEAADYLFKELKMDPEKSEVKMFVKIVASYFDV